MGETVAANTIVTVVSVAGLFEAEVQDRRATGVLGCALQAD